MNQIIYCKDNKSLPFFKNKSNKKYKILFIIFSSIAFLALLFLFYKSYQNNQNEIIAKKLTDSYSISTLYANSQDYSVEMQEASMENPFVIGIIKIEEINLNYSILSITSDDLLTVSVCRFAGPMPNEIGNLCIAGHNYIHNKFFGGLKKLDIGDKIEIYDLSGNAVTYEIYDIYETNYDDTSCTFQNTNNTRIVTLITCNNVNGKRLVLHAKELP